MVNEDYSVNTKVVLYLSDCVKSETLSQTEANQLMGVSAAYKSPKSEIESLVKKHVDKNVHVQKPSKRNQNLTRLISDTYIDGCDLDMFEPGIIETNNIIGDSVYKLEDASSYINKRI